MRGQVFRGAEVRVVPRYSLVGIFAALICFLALTGRASATGGTLFSGSFGEACSTNPCPSGQFKEPSAVAVNETSGDVYVVDSGDNRVEYFSSAGTYIGQFNGQETPAESFDSISGIAVDNSCVGGLLECPDSSVTDVYVLDAGHNVVDKFEADGKYVETITGRPGETFNSLAAVAVDSEGNLWVAQLGTIDEFDSNGSFLEQFTGTPPGPFGGFRSIALDSADHLYVITANGNVAIEQEESNLEHGASPLFVVAQPECDCDTALAFDDLSNRLFVDETTRVTEYTSTGRLLEEYGVGELASGAGVALNTTAGTGYVADSGSDVIHVFAVPAPPPRVTVEACGNGEGVHPGLAEDGVELCVEVNLHGTTATHCEMEWGTEPGVYAHTSSCSGSLQAGGDTPERITAELDNLAPGSIFYCRFAVTNEVATTYGPVLQFKSPGPLIGIQSVADPTPTAATLEVTINPDGSPTSYDFQYGTSTDYGSEAPVAPGTAIGSGNTAVLASQSIHGLTPNTMYHYRVAVTAELSVGHQVIFDGPDETFTTPKSPEEIAKENAELEAEEESETPPQWAIEAGEKAAREAADRRAAEATAIAAKKHQEEEAAAAANTKQPTAPSTNTLTLTISKVKVGSGALTLTLDLSQAGAVTISGSGLKTATETLVAGVSHVKISLTKAGRKNRKHHKKIKISAELETSGKTASQSKTIRL